MAFEVYLPKMSDHMETGRIVCWHFREGEPVERGQILLELETDKAVGEVEAPCSGILRGVRYAQGDEVPVGATVAYILAAGESLPGETAPAQSGAADAARPEGPSGSGSTDGGESAAPRATPLARKVARDLGVDLTKVIGSGPRGIIRDEDVRRFVSQPAPQEVAPQEVVSPSVIEAPQEVVSPSVIEAPPAVIEAPTQGSHIIPLNALQKTAAERMAESFRAAPHFYLQVSVDMTRALELLEQVRERVLEETGERASVTGVLVRAAAAALKRFPRANASFEKDALRVFDAVHIGVAVGGADGLAVPVIRDADAKTLAQITRELKGFQSRSERMRFSPEELSGGTFTISNLGMYGVDTFQAILNPPQSAILAVGRIVKTPMGLPDDTIALRPMMTITLSVDHRAMDGLYAAKFLAEVKSLLETPYLLI